MKAVLPLLVLLLNLLLPGPVVAAGRIISLAPSLTEMLQDLQLEEHLVAVLETEELDAGLEHLPRVGSLGQLDLEKVLSLQPDLVLNWPGSVGVRQLRQLEQLGIRVVTFSAQTMQELAQQYELLGEQAGAAQRGRELAGQIRQRLAALQQKYQRQQQIRVFYQLWDKPMYSLGGKQIISDALTYCAAENVLAHLQVPAPQVNLETVLATNPQVILLADPRLRRGWRNLEHIDTLVIPNRGLERPSWQMLAALEQLCQALAETAEE